MMLKEEKSGGRLDSSSSELHKRTIEIEEELSDLIRIKDVLMGGKEFFFSILAMMPVTLCLQAADYSISFTNKLFKDHFGDPGDRPCYKVLHGRDAPCEECLPMEALRTGVPQAQEWSNPEGLKFLVHYYPFENDRGERLVLEIGFDISEQLLAKKSLAESEKMLRRITDNMLDIVTQTDTAGIITFVTPSCLNVLGYEREELIGRSIFDLVHPDDLERMVKIFAERFVTLEPGRAEYRYRHADGSYLWLESVGSPLFDDGVLIGAIITTRNVTERRLAEDALRESEEKFRILSDQSLMGIHILQGGQVKYVNEATAAICGYPREEIFRWGPEEYLKLIHPDDRRFVLEQARKKEAGDKDVVTNYEWRLINKAGETRWIESFSKTMTYGDGLADFVMMTDVTERHNIEEERVMREEKMRDFLDVASHELRHPITVLKGYAAMLANQYDQLDDGTRNVILSIIDHGADRLNNLVSGLLDISHIERDVFEVHPKIQSIEPLIDLSIDEMRARGFSNDFVIRTSGVIPEVNIDGEKTCQLLIILLENAVKYSDSGTTIEVETQTTDNRVVVRVLDRGIGVPEEDRERIFERFFQVEDALHHSTPGMGMGLYIARHIVDAHGGMIWCEPRPGGGTIMGFFIPLESQETDKD